MNLKIQALGQEGTKPGTDTHRATNTQALCVRVGAKGQSFRRLGTVKVEPYDMAILKEQK